MMALERLLFRIKRGARAFKDKVHEEIEELKHGIEEHMHK